MPAVLLITSILLSTARNIFSKRVSGIPFGSRAFFINQCVIFAFGGISVILFGNVSLNALSPFTLLYALLYGIALICAQWFYTVAFSTGNTAICSTVYSMGFILPTLSGAIFWNEPFSIPDILGIMLAITSIIFSKKPQSKTGQNNVSRYSVPLTVAMLASGALGIIQKLQQKSPYPDERGAFLLMAFAVATILSLLTAFITRKNTVPPLGRSTVTFAALIGLFFGCCNLLNTILAGLLDSAIFFPTLNIGVIFLSMLSGTIIYKEKLSGRELLVLLFGSAAIALLNVF